MKAFTLVIFLSTCLILFAQDEEKKWYQNISLSGYVQVRYNGLYESNPDLGCEQCDKFWGTPSSFSIRRARLIVSGQIHPRIFVYFQPDFASVINDDKLNFGQLRDAYFDVGVDKNNEFRFRFGQSKVPYSFENLQSSRNRITLDRNDAMNSSFTNERDLGVYLMWAPVKRRALFKRFTDEGLKGSGDYGVVTIGLSNGQPSNTKELNKNKHAIARVAYPFEVKNQLMEAGVFGYSGVYTMMDKQLTTGVRLENESKNFIDQRLGMHYVLYPKPFGIQMEYNVGRGPEFNPITQTIETKSLHGGYILANYQLKLKSHLLIPFVKYHYYEGGKKFEQDARSYTVNEINTGVEWHPFKQFEIVAMYTYTDRRYEDYSIPTNRQWGHSIRLQAQVLF